MNPRKSMLRTLAAILLAAALGLPPTEARAQIPECLLLSQTAPSGPNDVPADTFADPNPAVFPNATTSNDYHWTHSSVHLQGAPALQKWGACVFFNPDKELTAPVDMTDWRSALVVNNPSPTSAVTATITYRDPKGIPLTSFQTLIQPEGTFVRGAVELHWFGRGIGSVEVTADGPIVGATLHNFGKLTLADGQMVTDPDIFRPGANSMQQLQMSQDFAKTLYSGPFPISSTSRQDFLNGVLPLNCVLNPNPEQTKVKVSSVVAPGTPLASQSVTLEPFGMYLDTSVWSFAERLYLNHTAGLNLDVISTAESSGGPILGDFLMVDVFGNGPTSTLDPGWRFRMGSGMMQNSPAERLINPEHVETGPLAIAGSLPSTPPVSTMMSVANVSGVDIGPLSVLIYNHTGQLVAAQSFPTLLPGTVRRLNPATLAIPENFAGWALIRACRPGLIGWTMREVWQQTAPPVSHFRKVFGEELDGANGAEPGAGFAVVDAGGQTWIRKVAPLLRAGGNFSNPPWWPSYVNAVNASDFNNTGPYWHRFFGLPGNLVGQQPFLGLQRANTSFTYVDPIVNPPFNVNLSGRFDFQGTGHGGAAVVGMEAIGDPFLEWGIPLFLGAVPDEAPDSGERP